MRSFDVTPSVLTPFHFFASLHLDLILCLQSVFVQCYARLVFQDDVLVNGESTAIAALGQHLAGRLCAAATVRGSDYYVWHAPIGGSNRQLDHYQTHTHNETQPTHTQDTNTHTHIHKNYSPTLT